MPATEETRVRLAEIPNLTVSTGVPLSHYTRFGIGGPADLYAETGDVEAFIAALAAARSSGIPTVVIGGGTNLIVSDGGFRGSDGRFSDVGSNACFWSATEGDSGGVWIWNVQQDRFGQAKGMLDFYHASEHLWAVARSLHPGDETAAQAWVEPLLSQLKHGEETGVLQTLNDLPVWCAAQNRVVPSEVA